MKANLITIIHQILKLNEQNLLDKIAVQATPVYYQKFVFFVRNNRNVH